MDAYGMSTPDSNVNFRALKLINTFWLSHYFKLLDINLNHEKFFEFETFL